MPELGNLLHSTQAETMLECYARVLAHIESNDERCQTILDLGCWAGCLSNLIAKTWPDKSVYGVDRACSMIDALTDGEKPDNLEFYCVDVENPEHLEGTSDLLISCFGFFELEFKEIAEATKRLSGDTGELILIYWNDSDEFVPNDDSHWDASIDELIVEMTEAGWNIDTENSNSVATPTVDGGYAAYLVFKPAA